MSDSTLRRRATATATVTSNASIHSPNENHTLKNENLSNSQHDESSSASSATMMKSSKHKKKKKKKKKKKRRRYDYENESSMIEWLLPFSILGAVSIYVGCVLYFHFDSLPNEDQHQEILESAHHKYILYPDDPQLRSLNFRFFEVDVDNPSQHPHVNHYYHSVCRIGEHEHHYEYPLYSKEFYTQCGGLFSFAANYSQSRRRFQVLSKLNRLPTIAKYVSTNAIRNTNTNQNQKAYEKKDTHFLTTDFTLIPSSSLARNRLKRNTYFEGLQKQRLRETSIDHLYDIGPHEMDRHRHRRKNNNHIKGSKHMADGDGNEVKSKQKLLIIVSGTHGVEAPLGTAIQTNLLLQYMNKTMPEHENINILLVHANNAYGYQYHRRCNSENVDLNRNLMLKYLNADQNEDEDEKNDEVSSSSSSSHMYDDIRHVFEISPILAMYKYSADPYLLLSSISVFNFLLSSSIYYWNVCAFYYELVKLYVMHGKEWLFTRVVSGQTHDPNGLFFGGNSLQIEHQNLKEILTKHILGSNSNSNENANNKFFIPDLSEVIIIDLHSGLGSYGLDTLMFSRESDYLAFRDELMIIDESEHNLQNGRLDVKGFGDESANDWNYDQLQGSMDNWCVFLEQQNEQKIERCLSVTQEFGTLHFMTVLRSLIDENALFVSTKNAHDAKANENAKSNNTNTNTNKNINKSANANINIRLDDNRELTETVSANMQNAFSVVSDELWRKSVVMRGLRLIDKILDAF